MFKLPHEVSKDIDLIWLHKDAPGPRAVLGTMEAIVRDCANTAWIALGGPSHKVSENMDVYRAQDHALTIAAQAILNRYGIES